MGNYAETPNSLSRVERVDITLWKEHRTWYLNLMPASTEILKKNDYRKLFNDKNSVK